MPGRTLALGAAFALIALLSFLTVSVVVQDGFSVLTAVSLLILALIGFGVIGALTQPPDDDH